jgi:hypothetical protein
MALNDLVVCVDQTEDALERLRLAADLAVRHDSYLTALCAREWSQAQLDRRKAAELGLVSAHGLSTLDNDIETAIAAAAERMRANLDERARADGLRGGTGRRRRRGRNCSTAICTLRRPLHSRAGRAGRSCFGQLYFLGATSVRHRPAGAIRARRFGSLGQHIAPAWNSSRPATRSLNDALPLIERAEKTTMIMIALA